LSTAVERVTTRPEGEAVCTVLLSFGTFLPHPSVLHALSTDPTVDAELRGEEGVFVVGGDGGEVTLDSEVVVVEAVAFGDEVGLAGFEELVDVTSGGVVHGVGTSCPRNAADIATLRSGEEGDLAENKSVVLDGESTFDSQDTELSVEDDGDTREGDVALEIVDTLGVTAIDGNGEAVEDLDTRSDVDDSGVEGVLGISIIRSVGDVRVVTSVPFATDVLETFTDVGLVEALRRGDGTGNATTF
jgi:hypothetical protein